ncbi:radical SAM protein [Methanopyrus sp.]
MPRGFRRLDTGNVVRGTFPEGCRLCVRGAKMVVFVTGVCNRGCWYCPVSPGKKGRDVPFANERPIRSDRDLIEEAELMEAEGASLTGGDPLIRLERTVNVIRKLKDEFGDDFHIHLYTPAESVREEAIEELDGAGLDELRVHPSTDSTVNMRAAEVLENSGAGLGFEMPAVPGEEDWILEVAKLADEYGFGFLNVNELEFTESNAEELRKRGFERVDDDLSDAVAGSEKTALTALSEVANDVSITLHYCPSEVKDAVQFRERIKRMAANVARDHEEVDEEGLIVKGIFEVVSGNPEDLANVLINILEVPEEWVHVDGNRVETKPLVVDELADVLSDLEKASRCEIRAWIVREYPTWDRTVVERWPVRG